MYTPNEYLNMLKCLSFKIFQINQYLWILDINDKAKINKTLEEHCRNVFSWLWYREKTSQQNTKKFLV